MCLTNKMPVKHTMCHAGSLVCCCLTSVKAVKQDINWFVLNLSQGQFDASDRVHQ